LPITLFQRPKQNKISAILLLLLFGACFCTSTFAAATRNTAPEKIRLQLKWFHQFQFAGYYAAIEQGY
jgi:ABC-type nitrate/sulfonate/bicarbonate transport system substrate-binding protein